MELASQPSGILMTGEQFLQLRDFIYEKSGIYFADSKKSLLENRLTFRLKAYNFTDYEKYYYLLKYDPQAAKELRSLYDTITTNETSFFRSPPQIEAFAEKALPDVMTRRQKAGEKTLRLWSAGCSTGEEAYTLGIVLKELLQDTLREWDIKIYASDISEKALRSAKLATYNEYALRGVPVEVRQKYFKAENSQFVVTDEIRALVELQFLNFMDSQRMQLMKGFDIIFCRNVLIYFDDAARKKIVSHLYDNINPGGYLFIGHSESLHNITRAFKLVHFPGALGYKKE
ncbi:MAG: CheR family methyltransferase [Syntrophaceae bacterium]